jgi:hypothetical protein
MKKKILALLLSLSILSLTGCVNENVSDTNKLHSRTSDATYRIDSEDERFMKIDSINGWIYVDKQTKVQYLFVKRQNAGGLTILVDEDGKPLLWQE